MSPARVNLTELGGRRGGAWVGEASGRGERPLLPTQLLQTGAAWGRSAPPARVLRSMGTAVVSHPTGPLCLTSLPSFFLWERGWLRRGQGERSSAGGLKSSGPHGSPEVTVQVSWKASSNVFLWESHPSIKAELQGCHLQKAYLACLSSLPPHTHWVRMMHPALSSALISGPPQSRLGS